MRASLYETGTGNQQMNERKKAQQMRLGCPLNPTRFRPVSSLSPSPNFPQQRAVIPDRSMALIGEPGEQELVFLDRKQ